MNTSGTAKVTTLESPDLKTENTFEQPKAIAPVASTLEVKFGTIDAQLQPYSLTVFRIPAQ
jgi:alpha-L-arabinofuranosidase